MNKFNQTNRSLRSTLLLGAASAAALGLAAPAMAQDNGAVETVVVTGSRIPQQGLYSSSPVTAIGSGEIKLEGSTSVQQTLRSLPSTVNDGDSQSVDNGTAGTATVDLRNLGAKRTLVLVDGKRLMPFGLGGTADLNNIPATAIDHVEVLTGGASAVYGSDAVSGVVNLILKKDFDGMEVDGQYTQTDHNDGPTQTITGMLGFNSADNKGNITLYGTYTHVAAVPESNRSYGVHALGTTNFTGCSTPATHFGGFCFSGSPTIAEGRIKTSALGGPYAGQTTMFDTNGNLVPYDGRTFNFAPFQFYQVESTRYNFGAEGHYDVNKSLEFYTRLTFSNSQQVAQIGASPLSRGFNINCGNPLMSTEERQTLFGSTLPGGTIDAQCASAGLTAASIIPENLALRLQAVGPRISKFDNTAYQMVFGLKGDLGSGWSYDLSAQYGHTIFASDELNDANAARIQDGLLLTGTSAANATCISGGSCIPINLFTANGITPTQAAYMRENLIENVTTSQWDIQGSVVGDLGAYGVQSPWAKNPVSVSFGGEYRQEAGDAEPDDNLATDNLVGNEAIAPTHGSFNVKEGFTEVRIPLIQGVPFVEDLTADGAYRYSSYNLSGSDSTYKYALEWSPTDDFKLRGSFERAVRAPNIGELFAPAGGASANSGIDPCSAAGVGLIQTTAALCRATGVPTNVPVFSAQLNCPTNQCQAAVGGNPGLKPEVADTRSLGVVLTPTFLDGFTATVDYYDIKINGFITATPMQTILNTCYSLATNPTQTPTNAACQFVRRDVFGTVATGVGGTGEVISAEGNIASDHVRGFDFEANYQADLGDWGMSDAGSLAFNYVGTLVTKNDTLFPGAPVTHCNGMWGPQCGEPENKFKGNLRMTWMSPDSDFSLSLRWRYLSDAKFDGQYLSGKNAARPCGYNACYVLNASQTPSPVIPAFNYFDLSGTWDLNTGLELRAGVSNIFGKKPPLVDNNAAPASNVNGNTFPNTYDALGRIIFVGGTYKL